MPVDNLKVELKYYYCRQDKVYSKRECKQSPVCTPVQFQLLWQILSSRESWWQQVSCLWELRPKQYETKKVWSNVRKGLRNFLLSPASSIGRRAAPTAWSNVGWSWFKKKKVYMSGKCLHPKHTLTNIMPLCLSRPVKPVCRNILVKVINVSLPHFRHLFPEKTTVSLCAHLGKKKKKVALADGGLSLDHLYIMRRWFFFFFAKINKLFCQIPWPLWTAPNIYKILHPDASVAQ